MAWAGAARQTAITMSRFVRRIFSAKGRDHRREDPKRVSRKGTPSWFWQCFRVVTHNCPTITIAAQDQPGCSILLNKNGETRTHGMNRSCQFVPSPAVSFISMSAFCEHIRCLCYGASPSLMKNPWFHSKWHFYRSKRVVACLQQLAEPAQMRPIHLAVN
jgi:hypothetical protein